MDVTRRFPPERVSSLTGISEETVVRTAREFASNRPAIAIADDFASEELIRSVWLLNHLVGATGKNGSIVRRRRLPAPWKYAARQRATKLSEIPDHSLRLLIVDGSLTDITLPWPDIQRKMQSEKATVVLCSPYQPKQSASVDYLLPVHAPYESSRGNYSGSYAGKSTFAISAPLWTKSGGGCETWQIVQRIVAGSGIGLSKDLAHLEPGQLLRLQSDAIFNSKRGSIHSPTTNERIAIHSVLSPDDFFEALMNGAVWTDDGASAPAGSRFHLLGESSAKRFFDSVVLERTQGLGREGSFPLLVVPVGQEVAARFARVSPILSKISQESDLRPIPKFAYVHHETARRYRLSDNQNIVVNSANGRTEVILRCDRSVRPDTIQVSIARFKELAGRDDGQTPINQPVFVRIERS